LLHRLGGFGRVARVAPAVNPTGDSAHVDSAPRRPTSLVSSRQYKHGSRRMVTGRKSGAPRPSNLMRRVEFDAARTRVMRVLPWHPGRGGRSGREESRLRGVKVWADEYRIRRRG